MSRWESAVAAHPDVSNDHERLRAIVAAWLDDRREPGGATVALEAEILAYVLLRDVIADVLGPNGSSAPGGAMRSIDRSIDNAIVRTVSRNVRDLRDEAVRAAGHARFLADATATLAASLDYDATLERVAQLAVPMLADWCVVDLVEDDPTLGPRRVSVAHRDPELSQVARDWALRYPTGPATTRGVSEVIRTRRPELVADVPDELLVTVARDADDLAALRALGLRSYLIVPLVSRDRALGAITLVAASSGRRYGEPELQLAVELARRAALAVENARAYQAARSAIRARDQLLSIVSHDLRNPLSALRIFIDMLRASPADPQSPRWLESVLSAIERMTKLVNDLLDTSAIHEGRFALAHVQVDPAKLVTETVEIMRLSAAQKNLELTHEIASGGPMWCDPTRVSQVLANLVGNAIKFCRPGDRIRVELAVTAGEARFAVADTGPGIAPEDLPHIFDPYWTTARDLRVGSGLGLYICKGIVEAHGGRIGVESAPGRGTRVTFTLPTVASA